MSKHTPGPWYWEGSHDHRQFNIYSANPDWRHIAHVNSLPTGRLQLRDPDRSEANARLIAAAPELLEAAKNLVAMTEGQTIYNYMKLQLEAARAAIAKAEGGTP